MLTLEPFSEDQGRSAVHPARGIPPISFLAPCGFTHPLTRTHVRLLGPVFQDGPNGVPTGRCRSTLGISPRRRVLPTDDRRDGISTSLSTARALAAAPIRTAPRGATGSGHDGALTLSGAPFQGTWARSAAEDASPDYNSDSEAVRFSSWADPGSLAVTKGILVHVHGSFCFAGFDNDPSAGSPTETLLRLLLPLNDKVQWNSRDVAGGEPPTLALSTLISSKYSAGGTTRPLELTAAAGTRLALQWILVKGFRLYSFQLPDSFEPGIVIYCHYLPVSGLGNLRACCLPWMW
ncbi:hypothetical protein L1887_61019 [Cichorium endivia]|nr:hypothetical protein L1887_61019 [Cichorium endivia]